MVYSDIPIFLGLDELGAGFFFNCNWQLIVPTASYNHKETASSLSQSIDMRMFEYTKVSGLYLFYYNSKTKPGNTFHIDQLLFYKLYVSRCTHYTSPVQKLINEFHSSKMSTFVSWEAGSAPNTRENKPRWKVSKIYSFKRRPSAAKVYRKTKDLLKKDVAKRSSRKIVIDKSV